MSKKLIYTFSLIGFFLMGGLFCSMTTAPRSESAMQATVLPQENPRPLAGSNAGAAIPLTGEALSVVEIFFVYAWFALGALILILALLNAANKRTVLYGYRKDPPDEL